MERLEGGVADRISVAVNSITITEIVLPHAIIKGVDGDTNDAILFVKEPGIQLERHRIIHVFFLRISF